MPARFWAALRAGDFVTWPRIRAYCTILALSYLAALAWALAGQGNIDPGGHPIGSDFVSFWTVSTLLQGGDIAAIYQPHGLAEFERLRVGVPAAKLFYAWFYPPIALLLVWPLALLPYLASLAVWLAAGLAAYLTAIRAILPDRRALFVAAAFPAVFVTLSHGQNAFVTTALLGGALVLLDRRPLVAGILIGALAFKPQLGVLIPFALLAGGHWRTIAAAAMTVLALAVLSYAAFGLEAWRGFFTVSDLSRQTLEQGLVPYSKMQSPFAAVRLLGAPVPLAYAVQFLVSGICVLLVAWAWRRPAALDFKSTALILATPLATPFVLDYDLLMLALPTAWLSAHLLKDGAAPYEKTCLAALFFLPVVTRPLAGLTGFCPTPFLLAACLGLVIGRMQTAAAPFYRPGASLR
ncbi:MAG TPA: glycosyltransferase family 87 protein [Alphaproteobacteria bacterium]|nr:glycosyltransferase family 87 protein [Alphaproteobacteria bacterium]